MANDIGVGADGSIWITGKDDDIVSRWNADTSTWDRSLGRAQQISVDADGAPWVVTSANTIWTATSQ